MHCTPNHPNQAPCPHLWLAANNTRRSPASKPSWLWAVRVQRTMRRSGSMRVDTR